MMSFPRRIFGKLLLYIHNVKGENDSMKLALIFTSKRGMENSYKRVIGQEIMEEDDEPPPSDMFAECDSDETIIAVTSALKERWEVVPIESDEYAYIRLQEENPRLVFNIAERLVGPSREAHT